jgi:hypothetical protein
MLRDIYVLDMRSQSGPSKEFCLVECKDMK